MLPFLVALGAYGGTFERYRVPIGADEPHYLVLSWSLLHDGDVELANNYDDAAVLQRLTGSPTIDAHAHDYRGDGGLISTHQVGLPLLLVPAVALGGRHGAQIALVVLAALLAQQLFRLLQERRIGRPWMVWAVWAGVVGSLPLMALAGRIFPDIPGALLIVVALRLLLRNHGRRDLVLTSAAIAALPWLHVRYSVPAALLGLGLLYRMAERRRQEHGRWRAAELVPLAAPLVSVVVLIVAFHRWYGWPLPNAPYRFPEAVNDAEPAFDASTLYRYGLGQLVSPAFGWLPAAPLHALGAVVIGLAARRHRAVTAWLVALAAIYVVVAGTLDPGPNLQARFLVPVVPLVALPLLVGLAARPRWLVAPAVALGVLTLVIGAVAASHPRLTPANTNGAVRLPVLDKVAPLFPNLSVGPKDTAVAFQAIGLPREVGHVVSDPLADNAGAPEPPRSDERVVEAGPFDGEGFLSFGPYSPLVPGAYQARFRLRALGVVPGEPIGRLEVAAAGRLKAVHELSPDELALSPDGTGRRYVTIDVPVRFPTPPKLEWRVRSQGPATLRLAAVSIRPEDPGLAHAFGTRFPSLPKVAAVVGLGLVLLIGLAVADRTRPEEPTAW